MPVYTKTGDGGITSLYGGKRVSKANPQVEAYGQADELSSFIGLLIAKIKNTDHKKFLTEIQKDLYLIMSFLAGAEVKIDNLSERVKKIEKEIDLLEKKLPKLNRFILPQGTEIACLFHITRSVCRRTERTLVRYLEKEKVTSYKSQVTSYLNRLSDLLFLLARFYNIKEITV